MAHIAKYQSAAIGNMCGHYERWQGKDRKPARDNVDQARTSLNYNLAPDRGNQVAFVSERIASLDLKRKPRKDAVVMCDCVLTMPRSLDASRERDFFAAGYAFLAARYGEDNVVSAWVHKDETTPHMHFAWVPVTGDGRLSAKDVVNRKDLRSLHRDMQRAIQDDLGCPVEVILDDAKVAEKALSAVPQKSLDAAREAMMAEIDAERRRIAAEVAAETERLESVRRGIDAAQGEVDQVEGEIKREIRRIREIDEEIEGARSRIEQVAAAVTAARTAIERMLHAVIGRAKAAMPSLSEAVANARKGLARSDMVSEDQPTAQIEVERHDEMWSAVIRFTSDAGNEMQVVYGRDEAELMRNAEAVASMHGLVLEIPDDEFVPEPAMSEDVPEPAKRIAPAPAQRERAWSR